MKEFSLRSHLQSLTSTFASRLTWWTCHGLWVGLWADFLHYKLWSVRPARLRVRGAQSAPSDKAEYLSQKHYLRFQSPHGSNGTLAYNNTNTMGMARTVCLHRLHCRNRFILWMWLQEWPWNAHLLFERLWLHSSHCCLLHLLLWGRRCSFHWAPVLLMLYMKLSQSQI